MSINKSYLELATEAATAMVGKGLIKIPMDKGENWKEFNKKAARTFGWLVLELYREIQEVPKKAREPQKDGKKSMTLIPGRG